jgi:hypothetical protein
MNHEMSAAMPMDVSFAAENLALFMNETDWDGFNVTSRIKKT